jgi:Zn-dependent protease with chaperone function
MNPGDPSFLAHATHPSLGEEPVDGRISVDRWQISFLSDQASIQIPLNRLQIEPGEAGEILFSDPEQPDWLVYTLDNRLLKQHALLQHSSCRTQIRFLRRQDDTSRRMKITAWCLAGFVATAMIVFLLAGVFVNVLVSRVPPEWEKKMGDEAMAEIKATETFVTNPKYLARLDSAVKPLLPALPTNHMIYQFYLVDDREPNAFALPGGHVIVTMGLLEFADTPEQVAGAMAHEIAHVNCKHHIRRELGSLGPVILCRLCMSSQNRLLQSLASGSELLITRSFSQEHELEADATGWNYLVAAHINPHATIELLTKFKLEEDRMKNRNDLPQAFSTHPATAKRIRILEKKWSKLKDKSNFVDLNTWKQ